MIPANLDDRICIHADIIHGSMSTSFLNNATSMIEAGCGIILHGFICMFKACSDRSCHLHKLVVTDLRYTIRRKKACVYSMETSATLCVEVLQLYMQ